jgi:hypothetical protein
MKFLKISLKKERSNLLSFGLFGRNFWRTNESEFQKIPKLIDQEFQ